MNDENITVKISGAAIHKAVKNCLKDSEGLQQAVAQALAHSLARMEGVIENAIRNKINTYEFGDSVRKMARAHVEQLLKEMTRMELVKLLVGGK